MNYMQKRKTNILLRNGLSSKVKKSNISSKDADILMNSINNLQNTSFKTLHLTGKVRKLSGSLGQEGIYSYRASLNTRILFSRVSNDTIQIHDIVNISDLKRKLNK